MIAVRISPAGIGTRKKDRNGERCRESGRKRDSDCVTALWSDEAGEADRDFFSLSLYFCVCSAVYGVNVIYGLGWAGPSDMGHISYGQSNQTGSLVLVICYWFV